jgi:hypothetical protein
LEEEAEEVEPAAANIKSSAPSSGNVQLLSCCYTLSSANMTAAPGSIADYDIVLSISEAAINRQLQILYNTPISDDSSDDLPPPTEVANGAPAAPSKYLINHDLEIHLKDEDGNLDMEAGITAHIDPPTVTFNSFGKTNDFRTGRISFKFKKDGSSAAPDSFYKYWSGHGPTSKLKSFNLNGYTMSWLVKFGQHNIGDVMKGALKQYQPLFIYCITNQ